MIHRWRYATCDPFAHGRKCGLADISYLPDVTWRTSRDYIEFTAGWMEGNAQRLREEKLREAQDVLEAQAWRRELEQARFEAARTLKKGAKREDCSKRNTRRLSAGAGG